jgi:hypothetical protein
MLIISVGILDGSDKQLLAGGSLTPSHSRWGSGARWCEQTDATFEVPASRQGSAFSGSASLGTSSIEWELYWMGSSTQPRVSRQAPSPGHATVRAARRGKCHFDPGQALQCVQHTVHTPIPQARDGPSASGVLCRGISATPTCFFCV